MKVILLEDVKSLGKKGQIVNVSDGYARNLLLPKKLGVEATGKNMNDLKLQKAHEDKVAQENLDAAKAFAEELKAAQDDLKKLQEALEYLNTVFKIGAGIQHKKYGLGTITDNNGNSIEIEFANGDKKKFGMFLSAVNNIIVSQTDDYAEQMQTYRETLKKEAAIKNAVSYAEKNFAEYAEYIDGRME